MKRAKDQNFVRIGPAARAAGIESEEAERLLAEGRVPAEAIRHLGRHVVLIDPEALREAVHGELVRYRGGVQCV
jgi:hypothetical protein